MFSAVTAFLLVARIDGQPESRGALSLMQYAAQSEFQAATETDEEYVCKDFCKHKSQCNWFVCKGCSFCPKGKEGCKSFCKGKSQCTWGACKDCSFCPKETEGCKSWCSAHPSPWAEKCKLNPCKGCGPCPDPTPAMENCKPWCSKNRAPWSTKCKLDPCKGCEPCPEPTPSGGDSARKPTTPEPTPEPTAAATPAPPTPQPTANNIYSRGWLGGGIGEWGGYCTCPDGQVYGVGDFDNSCGSMACFGGTAGMCNRYKSSAWEFGQVRCDPRGYR